MVVSLGPQGRGKPRILGMGVQKILRGENFFSSGWPKFHKSVVALLLNYQVLENDIGYYTLSNKS
jgi:hypothetical protein